MSEEIKMVALRIRSLRELSGYSIENVSAATGVSAEVYAGYESGDADIPVSFLYELAHLYRVDLAVLLTGEEPHMRAFFVVRRGRGASVDRRKDYKYQSLAYGIGDKLMEPFLVEVAPKDGPLNRYSHPGQEFIYVQEGKLLVVIGCHEITLEAGDSVYFNSGYEHAMKAVGEEPARFLSVIADEQANPAKA